MFEREERVVADHSDGNAGHDVKTEEILRKKEIHVPEERHDPAGLQWVLAQIARRGADVGPGRPPTGSPPNHISAIPHRDPRLVDWEAIAGYGCFVALALGIVLLIIALNPSWIADKIVSSPDSIPAISPTVKHRSLDPSLPQLQRWRSLDDETNMSFRLFAKSAVAACAAVLAGRQQLENYGAARGSHERQQQFRLVATSADRAMSEIFRLRSTHEDLLRSSSLSSMPMEISDCVGALPSEDSYLPDELVLRSLIDNAISANIERNRTYPVDLMAMYYDSSWKFAGAALQCVDMRYSKGESTAY